MIDPGGGFSIRKITTVFAGCASSSRLAIYQRTWTGSTLSYALVACALLAISTFRIHQFRRVTRVGLLGNVFGNVSRIMASISKDYQDTASPRPADELRATP